MRFSSLTFLAVAAGATFGLAAPSEANNNFKLSARHKYGCPNEWDECGVCDGASCNIFGGSTHPCVKGSCTGPGGGDGAACGYITGESMKCPGYTN